MNQVRSVKAPGNQNLTSLGQYSEAMSLVRFLKIKFSIQNYSGAD